MARQDVVGEGAQPAKDAEVVTDTGLILLERDIAGVVKAVVIRPAEPHLQALAGGVEDWGAGPAEASRPCHVSSPSTSHATCGFPALRAPICFTPKLMGPILLGRLSARRVALDRR